MLESAYEVLGMFFFGDVHFEGGRVGNILSSKSQGVPVCHRKLRQNKTHSKYSEPSIDFF